MIVKGLGFTIRFVRASCRHQPHQSASRDVPWIESSALAGARLFERGARVLRVRVCGSIGTSSRRSSVCDWFASTKGTKRFF